MAGQKLKGIQKHSQIASCKFIQSNLTFIKYTFRSATVPLALIGGFFINLENQSDKPLFWHLARRMRGRDIFYYTATCIDRDFLVGSII